MFPGLDLYNTHRDLAQHIITVGDDQEGTYVNDPSVDDLSVDTNLSQRVEPLQLACSLAVFPRRQTKKDPQGFRRSLTKKKESPVTTVKEDAPTPPTPPTPTPTTAKHRTPRQSPARTIAACLPAADPARVNFAVPTRPYYCRYRVLTSGNTKHR